MSAFPCPEALYDSRFFISQESMTLGLISTLDEKFLEGFINVNVPFFSNPGEIPQDRVFALATNIAALPNSVVQSTTGKPSGFQGRTPRGLPYRWPILRGRGDLSR